MEINKAFAIYASLLIAGTITVLTVVLFSGGQSPPPPAFIAEHLALSLLFRSAYKSFDGTNWFANLMDMTGIMGRDEEVVPANAATGAA